MKRGKFLSFLLVAMLVLLAGCGSGEKKEESTTSKAQAPSSSQGSGEEGKNEESKEKKEVTKLTFVLDYTPNTNHTGIYVAQKLGYFKEEGLDVTIMQPPEDGAPALVASGNAQFGVDYQDTIGPAFAKENPLPVTNIAALIQHNTSGLISLKENPVSRPKDLEGKTYASWGMPIEQAMVRDVIKKDGGDPEKLKIITANAASIFSMKGSDYQTIWVFYAWDGIAAKVKKIDSVYFPFRDFNPAFDYYTPTLIANNAYLKDHPEIAKAFLRAVQKGYEYAIKNPEKAADILLEQAPELDRDVVVESQKYLADKYIDDAPYWGLIDSKRWNRFYQWLFREKLIEKEIPQDFGFTNEYLPGFSK